MEYSANGTMTCYPSIRSHQFPRCQYIFADFSGTPILKYEQIVVDSGRTGMALRWEIAEFVHPHILQHGWNHKNVHKQPFTVHPRGHCAKVPVVGASCLSPATLDTLALEGRRDELFEGLRESVAHSQASWNVAWSFDLHKLRVWRIFIPWIAWMAQILVQVPPSFKVVMMNLPYNPRGIKSMPTTGVFSSFQLCPSHAQANKLAKPIKGWGW